jgi:hypothetical protein
MSYDYSSWVLDPQVEISWIGAEVMNPPNTEAIEGI